MAGRMLRLVALIGGELAAVVALHLLAGVDGLGGPGGDPTGWLRSSSPEEVVAGTIRLVALGCSWWLLASTVLYLVAVAAGRVMLARTLCRLVLPAIRRRVDRALAVSMMATATLGGGVSGVAAAGEPPPTTSATLEVRDGRAVEALPTPAPPPPTTLPPSPPPTTTGPPASVSPPPAPLPAPDPPPAPVEAAPAVHVVAAGESLWTIAAVRVAPGADVAPYWARMVEANRATLRSGNPNLIYPGEVVELPSPG